MQNSLPSELQAEFLKKKQAVARLLKRKLKQALKSKKKFLLELDNALMWEKVHHEATLLQSNLFRIKKGMTKIKVQDWLQDNSEMEIFLDPALSPPKDIAQRFKKSKKLKKGIEPLKLQYEKAQTFVETMRSLMSQIEKIVNDEELNSFCKTHNLYPQTPSTLKSKKHEPILPYRTWITEAGLQIWIGKSAKDNDKLTFTYAHGSDYWFHAHNVPGSHVVLHLGKVKEPDEESLKDAIQTALFYSKAKANQEGEVCITQCKYVSRFGKHQPGKVQISHHRIVFTKMDHERLTQLKQRKYC